MRKSAARLLTLATLSIVLASAPVITKVYAAGDENPSPPASSSKATSKTTSKKDKKKDGSSLEQTRHYAQFEQGYHAAYSTIYDRHDYASAIDQLKALEQDDNPSVATLIGYSYRKLGDYKLSQVWYERALKADPNHVKTWQYYGLWALEQGNREQAEYHLAKIAQLAGKDSEEYRSLSAALEQQPGTGLVY
jgi:tetratricopeptide (TPR) repeat protein